MEYQIHSYIHFHQIVECNESYVIETITCFWANFLTQISVVHESDKQSEDEQSEKKQSHNNAKVTMKAVGITENKGATNTKNAKAQILAGMDKVAGDVGVLQALQARTLQNYSM